MTDHDADVAAIIDMPLLLAGLDSDVAHRVRNAILAALTAAGIACVYVPEGVAVAHGARLVQAQGKDDFTWFTIEVAP